MTNLEKIKNYIKDFGTGISVEKFVSKVYRALSYEIEGLAILNDKYLMAGDERYQLIRCRSKGQWEVKQW